jgi:hypothetical protein
VTWSYNSVNLEADATGAIPTPNSDSMLGVGSRAVKL